MVSSDLLEGGHSPQSSGVRQGRRLLCARAATHQAFPRGTDQARTEIHQAFGGGYGELIPAACLVATTCGQVAGLVLTVRRAPWPDTPSGPFIIDLFTTPAHRRRGLARYLLHQAMAGTQPPEETVIGLRVEIDNTTAQHLYRSAGFHDWPSHGDT